MQLRRKEIKLFGNDIIVYMEKLMESTKQTLELTSGFSTVAEYRMNIPTCRQ